MKNYKRNDTIWWITVIVLGIVFIFTLIDLQIYRWNNIDMTSTRLFINRWEENVVCIISALFVYFLIKLRL